MEIRSLKIRGYRNLKDQVVKLGPRINVLVGDNGQGKTNFLEAIYLCSHGRSFRTSKFDHLKQFEKETVYLSIDFFDRDLDKTIELKFSNEEKGFYYNGKKTAASLLVEKLPTILFSPESLQAIKEGPEERRRLVDELLVSTDSANASIIAAFEKALRTKNRLLRDCASGQIQKAQAQDILMSLIPTYMERAVDLTLARIDALKAIKNDLQETFRAIVNKNYVDISVDYVISDQEVMNWTREMVIDAMNKRQQELMPRELDSGVSLVGPQKHEIRFLYNRNDSRFFCSQGQQRAIVLSFKISQVLHHFRVHKTTPVLLLDDVLSELDSERRDFLVRFLRESQAQTIVTTTDLAFCNELRGERLSEFKVIGGEISQQL